MQIAVDAVGGDFAPRNIVDGVLVAAGHLGFGLTLVGPKDALDADYSSTVVTLDLGYVE
jgi:fatty acid/phospholipid biosynthesis enzyme